MLEGKLLLHSRPLTLKMKPRVNGNQLVGPIDFDVVLHQLGEVPQLASDQGNLRVSMQQH